MAILVICVEALVYWKNSKVYYNNDESIHKIVLNFIYGKTSLLSNGSRKKLKFLESIQSKAIRKKELG